LQEKIFVFKEKDILIWFQQIVSRCELEEEKVSNSRRMQAPYEVIFQRQLPSGERTLVGRSVLQIVPPKAVWL
jgi:hypothetical protein